MSELLGKIDEASKQALRVQDKPRLATLRLILADIKKVQIDKGRDQQLSDADICAILDKMAKQRRESASIYREAGRNELADQEDAEILIISEFLPEPLSSAELEQLVDAALLATGASSMRDMGKLMAELKPQVQGRVDMQQLSKQLKNRLQSL